MKLKENKRVKYYDFGHKYFLNGKKELTGVTALMKKHGLSADYSGIDEEVLKHAAKMGSMAHKTIEDYCDGLPVVNCNLLESFKKLNLNIIGTEYLVSDEKVTASSIDLVNQIDETKVELIDMKRTSTTHTYPLSWQLGIYKYLFEMANPGIEVVGCYCLRIEKGGKDTVENDECKPLIPVDPQPAEKVIALLDCESRGILYTDPDAKEDAQELDLAVSEKDIAALSTAMNSIKAYEDMLKAENDRVAEIKDRIYNWMLDHDTDKLKGGNMQITLKKPYDRVSVDGTKLKKDYPEIYDKVIKTTKVKGNILINIK